VSVLSVFARHYWKKSNLRMVSLIKRGCLPTYQQVGPLSTVLLVACRLMQGVSVGGQLPASLIYTVEMSPKEHWGYYGSLVMMSGEQHAS
jgi:MHS family proline/betaine transporter-like MFS transporter